MAGLAVKQRILVLGSEHFVGTRVSRALSESDWADPIAFSGTPSSLSGETLAGVQAVFNGTMGSPAAILSNARALYGTLARLDSDVRVVHLSSMTVYGSLVGEAPEPTATRADLGPYGAAHIEAESLASRYARSVTLRPGCEYGPHCPQWSERIARLLCAHRLGDLGAAGDGVCNLLFIGDLVIAILACLRAPDIDGHCFNLAMRSPPTWNEYFEQFGRALGAVPIARIGGRRLKIETRMWAPPLKAAEMLAQRLHGRTRAIPPPITPSLINLCGQDITLNVDKAERALAVGWTPLREGLRQAAAAFHALQ